MSAILYGGTVYSNDLTIRGKFDSKYTNNFVIKLTKRLNNI